MNEVEIKKRLFEILDRDYPDANKEDFWKFVKCITSDFKEKYFGVDVSKK